MFFLRSLNLQNWDLRNLPYQSTIQLSNPCFLVKRSYLNCCCCCRRRHLLSFSLSLSCVMYCIFMSMEQSPPSEAVIQLVKKFQSFFRTVIFTFRRVYLSSSYLGFSVKNMNIKNHTHFDLR